MQTHPSVISTRVCDVIAAIPLLNETSDLHIEHLPDVVSLNNHNFRVTANGQQYVLHIPSNTAHWVGVRREEEREVALAAAQAGVAPEVVYIDEEGNLLTPFIVGRHWQKDDFHRDENIVRMAQALRQLHNVRDVEAPGSIYRRIERLLASARALELELPTDIGVHLQQLYQLEEMRQQDTRFAWGVCHNDLWANNFLDDGEHLWLLDWEFSGTGDGLIDLLTLSQAGQLSTDEQKLLLDTYGYTQPNDLKLLHAMKYPMLFFEALWSLIQHSLRGSGDYDYLKHSQQMFQWLDDFDFGSP